MIHPSGIVKFDNPGGIDHIVASGFNRDGMNKVDLKSRRDESIV